MYVNDLGTRDVAKLHSYVGSSQTTRRTSSLAGSFAEKLQKAAEQCTEGQEDTGSGSCCEKCNLVNRLVSQVMLQSAFMQTGLYGMGLTGLSSIGMGNMSSYLGMMNVLGSNWLT